MAKVFGIHEFEIVPGEEETFKELIVSMKKFYSKLGFNLQLLLGDRGEKNGKYALLLEMESPEARDRAFPPSDGDGGMAQQISAENKALSDDMDAKISKAIVEGSWKFTDYIVL
jgi:hypothetical protein